MSFAMEEASGGLGVSGYGGFRSRLRRWAAPQDEGEMGGGVGWAGEGLVATNGTGRRRWLNRPESGKTATNQRLLAEGVAMGWRGVA